MNNWVRKDLKYIWHPYTQAKDLKKAPPVLIERAKGIKLYDEKGNYYYDTISSWWCNIFGHNHSKIVKAIISQAQKLDHVLFAGFTHKPAVNLAQKLIEISPSNLRRVFFSDDGSTAVEAALKMSLQYWQNIGKKGKSRFVCLDRAYHGDTCGAMSVAGSGPFNQKFKALMVNSFKVPSPYCYRCKFGKNPRSCRLECIKPLEELLAKKHGIISGLIIEPLILGAGGMVIYPPAYLKKAFHLAKKYNVHFIADEIAVGFGRTGKMFASEYAKIKPDFMCLSKGVTSGTLPLAATLTTEKIYSSFYADYKEGKTFYHGHTYTANPIACAAAVATLNLFKEKNVLKKSKSTITFFHKQLESFYEFDFVGDVRYLGFVGALELVKDKKTKTPFPAQERIGYRIYQQGLAQHLLLRPLGDVIYFYLPLVVTKREINIILGRARKVLANFFSHYRG